ncbi:MAG: alginate export family protein [Candidatus Omnitrophica bacterium]|nr:alginate export family protein [Candidatus Omnitrophota bacterium]
MKSRSFHTIVRGADIALAVLTLLASASFASEKSRRVEEEKRQSLSETETRILKTQRTFYIDYGGWAEYRYDDYCDDDNDSSLADQIDFVNSLDMRFWMKAVLRPPANASYKNVHYVYVRMKELFSQTYATDKEWKNKQESPIVEYAYAVIDLNPLWIQAGRHYLSIGRGLAYSDVNDGMQAFLTLGDWRLKGLAARTLPRQHNIDLSVPESSDGSRRFFYACEGAYRGIPDHNFYSFFVIQKDKSGRNTQDGQAEYDYNSQYLGLGGHGDIIPNLHYLAEVIRETGTSRVFPSAEKADIDALAGIFELAYDADVYSHPRLSCRYAFGSGDKDRISVTDTVDGNTSGTDRNFLYFGYIDTGYALAPRLSNLHFLKGLLSCAPLEQWRPFRNVTVTTSWYWYFKDRAGGGITDTEATESEGYIGHEMDFEVAWQIVSDLSCTVQYGHFFTGDAFPETARDDEDYFSASVILTF